MNSQAEIDVHDELAGAAGAAIVAALVIGSLAMQANAVVVGVAAAE